MMKLKNVTPHYKVKWVAFQTPLKRVKRDIHFNNIYRSTLGTPKNSFSRTRILKNFRNTSSVNFDDPLFDEQWYLLNKGQTGSPPDNDINVLPVWESGITGEGVRFRYWTTEYTHSARRWLGTM
ncbi:neuroendocrine convertase 1 [Caerostris extrusa]|uniref:Neuroendocrine convertase 1 n=1 Tax=Caerostris extrusa TaxID=172846 RepID=A0AAV4MW47_CAEEX|nr:neuroendocrine convertase 1 [Caerostris extrusa]